MVAGELKGLFQSVKKVMKFELDNDKKRLLENFISLSVLQGANYILPLITLPYLVRVLGPEKFGLIAFAQAFIQYFNILTDYGFNLSATREISIHSEDKEKVSEIFSSVMVVKFALLILSFIIMTVVVFSFEKFRKDWLVYYLTFGVVVGQVFFPVWFFQGMERMKYITFLNTLAKVMFTIAIFIFVRKVSDYLYVPLLNSLGFIIVALLSLGIVFRKFRVRFKFPSKGELFFQLNQGWHIFVSVIAISSYRNFNIFALGLFANNFVVGNYAIAEKILKAIQGLQNPVGQALFPFLSKKFSNIQIKNAVEILAKYSKFVFVIYFFLFVIVFFLSPFFIKLASSKNLEDSLFDLRILSFVILIGGLNYYFGILGLISLGFKKEFSDVVSRTGLFNIIIGIILIYFLKDIGASITLVLSESLLLYQLIYQNLRLLNIKGGSNFEN